MSKEAFFWAGESSRMGHPRGRKSKQRYAPGLNGAHLEIHSPLPQLDNMLPFPVCAPPESSVAFSPRKNPWQPSPPHHERYPAPSPPNFRHTWVTPTLPHQTPSPRCNWNGLTPISFSGFPLVQPQSRTAQPLPGAGPEMPTLIFLTRSSWEKGLGDILACESSARHLSSSKHGVHIEVPVKEGLQKCEVLDMTRGGVQGLAERLSLYPQQESHSRAETSCIWKSDPLAALDLGVVATKARSAAVEEEAFLPRGYEGAPAVVLNLHEDTMDEPEESSAGTETEQKSTAGGYSPMHASRLLRIVNDCPGPYVLREVLILPKDETTSACWIEVEVGGWIFSSQSGRMPWKRSLREMSPSREEKFWTGAPEILLCFGTSDAHVTIKVEPESESRIVKKWVLFRIETPGMGPAHDFQYHSFVLGRKVVASVADRAAQALLNVEARAFVPQGLRRYFDEPCNMVSHPDEPSPFQPVGMANVLRYLPDYFLPDDIRRAFLGFKAAKLSERSDPYALFGIIKSPTTVLEYCRNMRAMLYLEEAQAGEDVRRYDLFGVPITYREKSKDKPNAPLVATISVPGAAEKRPPLAYGDCVRLRPSSLPAIGSGRRVMVEMRAVVLETREEKVKILLPPKFPTSMFPSDSRFHIRFTYDRYGFRFLHRALYCFSTPAPARRIFPNFFFPPEGGGPEGEENEERGRKIRAVAVDEPAIQWVNRVINEEQRRAVLDIVNQTHGSLPYILYGPPGTGKTLTVIEAILQICRHHPRSKVLAVAPSDVAADILAERLSEHMEPKQLFRLNWCQRLMASMKPSLLRYSCWDAKVSLFSLPDDEPRSILEHQVIVSTCASSGLLSLLDISGQTPVSFSHILVDEASQALQPEVMVPLSLAGPDTGVVLAGDPKQLGAVTRNPLVQELGLARSLQERLMETCSIYRTQLAAEASATEGGVEHPKGSEHRTSAPKEGDPGRCLTMLRKNYRSHQAIIEVPSRMFYDRTLEQHGDKSVIDSMLAWEMLPGSSSATALDTAPLRSTARAQAGPKGFPILFWGCLGEHMHELDSPSFFNVVECGKVLDLVHALLSSTRVQVRMQDIAIISAFRKQVLKLRSLLREKGYGAINIGQVEDFQGQETKVVIISTVLSARHPNEISEQLGFLGHPKRFNVAITRAQALTVIVGNPYALWEDVGGWRQLLEFCKDHGALRGSSGPLGTPDVESVESLLDTIANESLLGKASSNDIYPTSLEDYFSDSPWRLLL